MLFRDGLFRMLSLRQTRSGLTWYRIPAIVPPTSYSGKHTDTSSLVTVSDGENDAGPSSSAHSLQRWCTLGSVHCVRLAPANLLPSLSCQRCELFHGIKDLQDRMQPDSQTRHYHAVSAQTWSYLPWSNVELDCPRRWMSYKKRKGGKRQVEEDEDEDEELMEEGEEEEEFGAVEEDGPPGYKDIRVHLKSLRVDAVLASGLNMARNKAEEYFYSSKLRLNGEKVLKKSKQMGDGDYVDAIMETGEATLRVKRVKLLRVLPERTNTDKFVVLLRTWRSAFDIPRPDSSRPF